MISDQFNKGINQIKTNNHQEDESLDQKIIQRIKEELLKKVCLINNLK